MVVSSNFIYYLNDHRKVTEYHFLAFNGEIMIPYGICKRINEIIPVNCMPWIVVIFKILLKYITQYFSFFQC